MRLEIVTEEGGAGILSARRVLFSGDLPIGMVDELVLGVLSYIETRMETRRWRDAVK